MQLNLLTDRWIPVRTTRGYATIAPGEMVADHVVGLAWTRGDLNLACLELLIALVAVADPPRDADDWDARARGRARDRLQTRLAALAWAFELGGAGPRFMQDEAPLEDTPRAERLGTGRLFIDAPGKATAKRHADLFVRAGRYTDLDPPTAAMALYTLQSWATGGGPGHRAGLRGGGPMVTLAQAPRGPQRLWRTVWANVPFAEPCAHADLGEALPWLAPARTSRDQSAVTPRDAHPAHVHFACPRRIRLTGTPVRVEGFVQKNYGAWYRGWTHPLSPYRYNAQEKNWRAMRAHPGRMTYDQWTGSCMLHPGATQRPGAAVQRMDALGLSADHHVLAGGWATHPMKLMKVLDFHADSYPCITASPESAARIEGCARAAATAARVLTWRMEAAGHTEGSTAESASALLGATEDAFLAHTQALALALEATRDSDWIATLRRSALKHFDTTVMARIGSTRAGESERIAQARKRLRNAFAESASVAKALRGETVPGEREPQEARQ